MARWVQVYVQGGDTRKEHANETQKILEPYGLDTYMYVTPYMPVPLLAVIFMLFFKRMLFGANADSNNK